jgi:hypothetical protein
LNKQFFTKKEIEMTKVMNFWKRLDGKVLLLIVAAIMTVILAAHGVYQHVKHPELYGNSKSDISLHPYDQPENPLNPLSPISPLNPNNPSNPLNPASPMHPRNR